MITLDPHVHTTVSSDGRIPPDRVPELARLAGLDRVAICDHNSIEGARWLVERFPGLAILGEEIRTLSGEIIGLYLRERIPPGLSLEETLARIKEQGGLSCCPHPFDGLRSSAVKAAELRRVVGQLDLLEVGNSRTILPHYGWLASRWVRRYGLTPVVGSDAHRPEEVGLARAWLPEFGGPAELLQSLQQARLTCRRVGFWARLARRLRYPATARGQSDSA